MQGDLERAFKQFIRDELKEIFNVRDLGGDEPPKRGRKAKSEVRTIEERGQVRNPDRDRRLKQNRAA